MIKRAIVSVFALSLLVTSIGCSVEAEPPPSAPETAPTDEGTVEQKSDELTTGTGPVCPRGVCTTEVCTSQVPCPDPPPRPGWPSLCLIKCTKVKHCCF
jgi:hypothetical protein